MVFNTISRFTKQKKSDFKFLFHKKTEVLGTLFFKKFPSKADILCIMGLYLYLPWESALIQYTPHGLYFRWFFHNFEFLSVKFYRDEWWVVKSFEIRESKKRRTFVILDCELKSFFCLHNKILIFQLYLSFFEFL